MLAYCLEGLNIIGVYSFVELFHAAAGAASAPHSACLLSAALQEPFRGSCYCDAASRRQILAPTPAAAASDFSTAPDSPDCIKLPGSNTDCLLLQCQSTVAGACAVLTRRTISCCNKRVSLPPRMAQAPSPPLPRLFTARIPLILSALAL